MALISQNMRRIPASQTMAVTDLARQLKAAGKDVISMATGEPDFDTVPLAADAGIAAIRGGETRYTAVDGTPDLKEAICAKFKRDNGLDFDKSQVSVASGGKQIIYNAMAASLDPGDEVIIPVPYWVSYPAIVQMCGGVPVQAACHAADGFALRPDTLDAAITPKTKWLMLNYPNNPTGGVMDRKALEALAEVLRRHRHVHVLSDDIYEILHFPETPFLTLAQVAPDLSERIVTMNGVSKGYAMTGWRIGFCGGPSELIAAMGRVQSQVTGSPSAISQAAAATALRAEPDHARAWCETFVQRRDIVVAALNAVEGVSCETPLGAFYAFPDVSGLFERRAPDGSVLTSAQDVARFWLEEAGVAGVPGDAFGAPAHMRLSYSIATDQVSQAMERIAEACARSG